MLEAAAVMSGYSGTPEDNAVFSQELDGNSTVCLPHPEERTQGTWSAASLHLIQRTYMHGKHTYKHTRPPFDLCMFCSI